MRPDKRGVARIDSLLKGRKPSRVQAVAIERDSRLKTVEPHRPGIESDVDSFAVIFVHKVLDRHITRMSGGSSVRNFGDPMQTEGARWNRARHRKPEAVNRQDSAVVFISKQRRLARGSLEKPCAMKSIRVKTNSGVVFS